MPPSIYKKKKNDEIKKKAVVMYKSGLSCREVSAALEQIGIKKSYAWVSRAVNELSTV